MTIDNSFIKCGRLWFQWRSFSPVPLFLALALLPAQFTPSNECLLLSFLTILASEALRVWAVGFAGSVTRTRNDHVPKLVHDGPYRHVRNPLYIANIAMYTATGFVFGFWIMSAVIFIYATVQYIMIVAYEEANLKQLFGDSYANYLSKVPRWIPSLTPQVHATNNPFQLKAALRSERGTFYSMLGMLLLYVLKYKVL